MSALRIDLGEKCTEQVTVKLGASLLEALEAEAARREELAGVRLSRIEVLRRLLAERLEELARERAEAPADLARARANTAKTG